MAEFPNPPIVSGPAPTDGQVVAYQAAQTLIASIGGSIESDDATFSTARSVVRLRV